MGTRLVLLLFVMGLGLWVTTTLVRRWSYLPGISPKWLFWSTATSLLAWMLLSALPLAFPQRLPSGWIAALIERVPRKLDYGLLLLFITVIVGGMGWGILRLLGDRAIARDLEVRSTREELALYQAGEGQIMDAIRINLSTAFEEEVGREVRFRFASSLALPFTRPDGTIFVPVYTLKEADGKYAVPLLEHEKNHLVQGHERMTTVLFGIRAAAPWLSGLAMGLRRGMEVEADRRTYREADEFDQAIYVEALHRVVAHGMGDLGLPAIGHDSSDIPKRVEQMRTPPRIRTNLLFAFGLALTTLIPGAAVVAAGGVEVGAAAQYLLLQTPPTFGLHIADQRVESRALLGAGGAVPDGLRVDTTRCSPAHVASTEVYSTAWMKHVLDGEAFNGKDARLAFRYRVRKGSTGMARVPGVTLDALSLQVLYRSPAKDVFVVNRRQMASHFVQMDRDEGLIVIDLPNAAFKSKSLFCEVEGPCWQIPPGYVVDIYDLNLAPIEGPTRVALQTENELRAMDDAFFSTWDARAFPHSWRQVAKVVR